MQAEKPKSQSVPWTPRDVWIGLILFGLWLIAALVVQVLLHALALKVNIGLLINLEELLLLVPVWWLTVRKYRVEWEKLGLRAFTGEAIGLGCGLIWIFAFLYYQSRSIWPAILMHVPSNTLALGMAYLSTTLGVI